MNTQGITEQTQRTFDRAEEYYNILKSVPTVNDPLAQWSWSEKHSQTLIQIEHAVRDWKETDPTHKKALLQQNPGWHEHVDNLILFYDFLVVALPQSPPEIL